MRFSPFRSWRFFALAAVLAIAAGGLQGCDNAEPNSAAKAEASRMAEARPVRIHTVEADGAARTRQFSGRVRAVQTVDLSFQVGGEIVKMPVRESQRVKKGDLIAALDKEDFERRLREAKVRRDLAKAKLERISSLRDKKVTSEASYDDAKAEYDLAVVAVETAQQNLEYAEIHAPYDAIITKRLVDTYTVISSGTQVVRIQDMSEIQIDINVPETLFARVTRQQVESMEAVFSSAPERRFPLEYREHETEADSVAQTYRVTLAMPVPEDINILPGMTASVFVKLSRSALGDGNLRVPAAAVGSDAGKQPFVWVLDPDSNAVSRRPVELGPLRGDQAVITDGLEPGEQIVSAGVSFLQEGQVVRPLR